MKARKKKSPFKLGQRPTARPSDPESVFADLRLQDESVKHLWSHQADILREYQRRHSTSTDVALELPTGMGKTLVGLLIGEYRRRAFDERVAYLCPTRQLANQVANQANSYGFPAVLLVGPQAAYPAPDHARYVAGNAIAITTYSGVFNTNPRLNDANVLILDDAHAGGDYVAALWSLTIGRELPLYRRVVELFADSIPSPLFMRLLTDDIDPRDKPDVFKLPTNRYLERRDALTDLLTVSLEGDAVYGWRMIRDHLQATHFYVAWSQILIRPLIPPTLRHNPFANARQRVYMSATLGAGGELERVMGVESLGRVPVPETWESQRTGRRFILFPSYSLDAPAVDDVIREAVDGRDRTLLICPSRPQAVELAERLRETTRAEIFDSGDIEHSLVPFSEHRHAALVLSARYDGIDLPDQSCRQLVLLGLPSALNLQERFLTDKLRAQAVLRDRIRTRVTQGIGRCTRNPSDYAAVLLCGSDILEFCLRRENRHGMPRELQAEVRFGLDNSDVTSSDDVNELLSAFYAQDDRWAGADSEIRTLRAECSQMPDAAADQLMGIVPQEVRYSYALWDAELERTLQLAREVADQLGGDELRNYRAWWLYLGAAAAALLAERDGGRYGPVESELLERARTAASVSWIRSLGARGRNGAANKDRLFLEASENVVGKLRDFGLVGGRFEKQVTSLQRHLHDRTPEAFHQGMALLGEILGFRTSRPAAMGDPDVVWRLEPHVALIWEAKSQVSDEGPISLATARQCVGHANGAGQLLRLHDGEGVFVILACHRAEIAREAVPQVGDTRAVTIAAIQTLAEDAVNMIRRARARLAESSDAITSVQEDMRGSGLIPELVIRRLTAKRAGDLPAV
jgi:hypothetical protein